MAALAVQVEIAVILAVEVDAPVDEFLYLLWSLAHHLLHGSTVADVVAGNDGVGNMLVEGVDLQVGDRGDTALGERRVSLVETCLADHTYLALFCAGHLQCIAHAGHTGSDNKEIVLVNHFLRFR